MCSRRKWMLYSSGVRGRDTPGNSRRYFLCAIFACATFGLWSSATLVVVDRRVVVVVAPVEPVVFEGGDAIEAFAERRSGDGAALEIPFAGGCGVEQDPGFGRCGSRCR